MFENLIEDIKKQPIKSTPQISVDFSDNPSMNVDLFKQKLKDIDNVGDDELYNIITKSLPHIVKDVINHTAAEYTTAFINPRVITIMTQIVSNIQPVPYDLLICCNKLAYDYNTMKTVDADKYLKRMFYILSKTSTRGITPLLMQFGIPESIAVNLCMARYSNIKEVINVKRLNFVIMTSTPEIMTVQNIVWIYEKLFDRITPLFIGMMFDVLNDEEEWVTDEIMEVYSTISIAVLEMVNNMPSENIRKVLMEYAGEYQMLHSRTPNSYRFSLHALSGDFERVRTMVEVMTYEGHVIP